MTRAWVLALLCFATTASAQPASEPTVRATIDPPSVVVGQRATVTIDVLAPNYMTQPPALSDLQLSNAVTRAGAPINLSEQRDGASYAGIRFEFFIYPQEPGAYAVTGKTVALTYAADPPHTRHVVLGIPALRFAATIPAEALSLDPFVSAESLTVRQEVRPSVDPLKIGDAVMRTVRVEARGTPAMLLPPAAFAAVPGTRIYPAQPELLDGYDSRTGLLSASRTDRATYMIERAGVMTIPSFELRWWNTRDRKVEIARVEPVALQAGGRPAGAAPSPNPAQRSRDVGHALLFVVDHWQAALAFFVVAGALAWRGPALVGAVRTRLRRRRNAYRGSEACAFADLERAAHGADGGTVYAALLLWLLRFAPVAPARTIGALDAAARDPLLDREIAGLERRLFAEQPGDAAWSGPILVRRLARARHRLFHPPGQPTVLPATLNPAGASPPPELRARPVAR